MRLAVAAMEEAMSEEHVMTEQEDATEQETTQVEETQEETQEETALEVHTAALGEAAVPEVPAGRAETEVRQIVRSLPGTCGHRHAVGMKAE